MVDDLLNRTKGELMYVHDSGETSRVIISQAGLGRRNVRIANLPPEMPGDIIRKYMEKYGTVTSIQEEKWATIYRYNVNNGIRIVNMDLRTHVPSHIYIDGYRALISYVGQPHTCYICGGVTHIALECPSRKYKRPEDRSLTNHTWANVVNKGPIAQDRLELETQTNSTSTNNTNPKRQTLGEQNDEETRVLKQGKELEQESTEELMELDTIDRTAAEDKDGEKTDTIGITTASDESSTLTPTKERANDIDTTYEHKDEQTETTSHSDIECEGNQNKTRII